MTAITTRSGTIRDVAARAGVAVSTVSIVFGGTRSAVRISDATTLRVRRAAEEVGYFPNATARALRLRRTQTIGVLLSDGMPGLASDAPSGMKIRHLEAACAARGYMLQVMRYDANNPQAALSTIAARTVDGLILTAFDGGDMLELCERLRLPCVDVAGTLGRANTCAVEADLVGSRIEALRYAAGLGHERIALAASTGRQQAEIDAAIIERAARDPQLSRCRISPIVLPPQGDQPDGRPLLEAWLGFEPRQRPSLLMAHEGTLMAFLVELSSRSMSCPRDVSVIGLSRSYVSDLVTPRLTGIETPIQAACERGVSLLIDGIESSRPPVREDSPPMLACRLVVRDSCASPAV